MSFLEDKDIAIIFKGAAKIFSLSGSIVRRDFIDANSNYKEVTKEGYQHFMLKEIFEQPATVAACLQGRLDISTGKVVLDEITLTGEEFLAIEKIYLIGCGTSRYSSLVIKYFYDEILDIPVEVEYGSEFRYRNIQLEENALLVAITQSGETVDTLSAIEVAQKQNVRCLSIVNVEGSQAHRLASAGSITMRCGPEIAVACTKSFAAQIVCGYLLGLKLAQVRKTIPSAQVKHFVHDLSRIPALITRVLSDYRKCEVVGQHLANANHMLYLGRWISYPIALEGALKMLELSYIPVLAYPAGEIKHGPLALISKDTPVICIIPEDKVYDKMYVNIEQVRSRFAQLVVITSGKWTELKDNEFVIEVPQIQQLLSPILTVVPLQLLSYYTSFRRGCEIDQPRNLAKSVTVE